MSGKRKDPIAMAMRVLLRMASVPYAIAVRQRNRNYDRQIADIQQCDVPVISVGNMTTGGTGKTPIVCLLAKRFRKLETTGNDAVDACVEQLVRDLRLEPPPQFSEVYELAITWQKTLPPNTGEADNQN